MTDKPESNRRLPPVGKRWQKGVSGNPRGRPKKRDSLTSILKEEMGKICLADRERRTMGELIVQAMLREALKGNTTALGEIWERVDGKVPQIERLNLTGPLGGEVKITLSFENGSEKAAQWMGKQIPEDVQTNAPPCNGSPEEKREHQTDEKE